MTTPGTTAREFNIKRQAAEQEAREEIAKPLEVLDPIFDGDGKLVDPVADLFSPRKIKRIDKIGRY